MALFSKPEDSVSKRPGWEEAALARAPADINQSSEALLRNGPGTLDTQATARSVRWCPVRPRKRFL